MNSETCKENMKDMMESIRPMSAYKESFIGSCTCYTPRISTGILSFDKILNGGLSNELYILSAETSTGKSAFMMHTAQKVAENGTDVLYFALEMSREEFAARGISAISHEHHLKDRSAKQFTAADILYWKYDDLAHDFLKLTYKEYAPYTDEYFERCGSHLHIIESGINGLTAKDIANMATLFRNNTRKPVAVFVDYLQLVRADPKDHAQADRKSKLDGIVTVLKVLASQIGMPVMTISSVGRSSYNKRITEGSGKESGETEYTAGVLIGWNWEGVTTEENADKRAEEKKRCNTRGYRHMTLEVLKYRNSQRDTSIHLKYIPAYSYFEEYTDWQAEERIRQSEKMDKAIYRMR